MKGRIILALSLAVGLATIGLGIASCTKAEKAAESNQACPEPFSMVVSMGGKELTIGAPRLSPSTAGGVVTLLVKNSGNTPIAVAEIEIICWEQFWRDEEISDLVRVKDLSPGEVQTIVWNPGISWEKESLRIRVRNVE